MKFKELMPCLSTGLKIVHFFGDQTKFSFFPGLLRNVTGKPFFYDVLQEPPGASRSLKEPQGASRSLKEPMGAPREPFVIMNGP